MPEHWIHSVMPKLIEAQSGLGAPIIELIHTDRDHFKIMLKTMLKTFLQFFNEFIYCNEEKYII